MAYILAADRSGYGVPEVADIYQACKCKLLQAVIKMTVITGYDDITYVRIFIQLQLSNSRQLLELYKLPYGKIYQNEMKKSFQMSAKLLKTPKNVFKPLKTA